MASLPPRVQTEGGVESAAGFNPGWDLSPRDQLLPRLVGSVGSMQTVSQTWLLAPPSRFNKLGLDHLSLGEEPAPHQQVEEALSFTPLGSAPLDQEPLLSVDLGTAHSAAVTGE